MSQNGWGDVAIDETNRGDSPEIIVAVFSNYQHDLVVHPEPSIPKIHPKGGRGLSRNLARKLEKRDYSFIILDVHGYAPKSKAKVYAAATASLLEGFEMADPFNLHIDGIMLPRSREYMNQVLGQMPGIKDKAIVREGKSLDRRMPLVNLADETAYWLRSRSFAWLLESPKRVRLNRSLLDMIE